jgi:hypothetical protein
MLAGLRQGLASISSTWRSTPVATRCGNSRIIPLAEHVPPGTHAYLMMSSMLAEAVAL